MARLQLRGPDGASRQATGSFGRTDFSPEDTTISRLQFTVEPVENAIILTCRGANAMVVEVLEPGGQWQTAEYVEHSESTVVGPSMRFYMCGRKETTMFSVIADQLQDDSLAGAEEPPQKRQRLSAENGHSSEGIGSPKNRLPAALHLLRTKGIADQANEGMLGLKLSDLVCGRMRWVFISNYMVDLQWLLSEAPDLADADQLMIAHGWRRPVSVAKWRRQIDACPVKHKLTQHQPPLDDAFGCHHSKVRARSTRAAVARRVHLMMIEDDPTSQAFMIEYETGVRVIVHTANLIRIDFDNKTQGMWWQDFPRKTEASPKISTFERELSEYLDCLGLPAEHRDHAARLCREHDFSAARAHLVVSRPGRHTGTKLNSYGHMALRRLLSSERFPDSFAQAPMIAQFSSLGSLNEDWLREFRHSMASGLKSSGQKLGDATPGPRGLQLVWPTAEEVRLSLEGWSAGDSIPGPAKNVDRPFLQQYWHRFGGELAGRQTAMPHMKSYSRYRGDDLAWFMLSSHNLSCAAWGKLQKQGSQLHIMHYELAVLFVPSLEAAWRESPHWDFTCQPGASATQTASDPFPSTVPGQVQFKAFRPPWYNGTDARQAADEGTGDTLWFPVPYTQPPVRYKPGDVPWSVRKHHPGMDNFGVTLDRNGEYVSSEQ